MFTKIFDRQVKLLGRNRETIRICKEQGILREYLGEREKEVIDIMIALFDEEYILKTWLESEIQEGIEKGLAKATKEVAEKATKEATEKAARILYEKGVSIEIIAETFDLSAEETKKLLSGK